ncbi:MAG: hypothetical protein AAFQ98_13215 [Bacteroidota bacterium]
MRIIYLSLLLVAFFLPHLSVQGQDYPYHKHLPRITPHKPGYEYLRVLSDTKARYYAIGVQTGIVPSIYVGPFEPPLFTFPGIWIEEGNRTYLPSGRFWDWAPHLRVTLLRWQQPHETLGFPRAFWEGIGLSTGTKFLYGIPAPSFQAFGKEWKWHIVGGLGAQLDFRRQRDMVYWNDALNDYFTNEIWDFRIRPTISGHFTMRLGHGK